jgi:hypothetical protein
VHEFGNMLGPEFRMCHEQVTIGCFGAFLNDETTARSLRHEAIEDMELRGIEDLGLDRSETKLRIAVPRRLERI